MRIQARHVFAPSEFPKNLAQYSGNTSSKVFSCIRASVNTGPACIRAKINSPRIFSCMYWFCAGGYYETPVCSQNLPQFLYPLTPPPPNQPSDEFPLEFLRLLEGPQTELRTLSRNCEQTLQRLRTKRIII